MLSSHHHKRSGGGMLPTWVQNGRGMVPPPIRRRPLPLLALCIFALCTFLYLCSGIFSPDLSAGDPILGVGSTLSPFLVSPKDYIPIDLGVPPGIPLPVPPRKRNMTVPDAVHYVYGLKPPHEGETGSEFPYYAYLSMRSVIKHLRPKKIFFHYKYEPQGPWWDLIVPHLTLVETTVPHHYFDHEIKHFAHQADIVRLWALLKSGGIYLDIDMYIIRPFDDLLSFPVTMGMERSPNSQKGPLDPTGLCNGVIIAAPDAPFIKRWLESYRFFNGREWAEHSVALPWDLARSHPTEIQVLNTTAFFWPMWQGQEVQKVHELDEYDWNASGQYAYHAWESLAMEFLLKLNPVDITKVDTSFHRLVRPFISPEDYDAHYEAIKWREERDARQARRQRGAGDSE